MGGSMLRQDLRQYLLKFVVKHPKLTVDEGYIISEATDRLQRQKRSQEKEMIDIIRALRQLSYQQHLSQDGWQLLTKLQRKQWIWGVVNTFQFFGH